MKCQFSNQNNMPPQKSLSKRLISYFLVFTLLFQTSLPAIAAAMNESDLDKAFKNLSEVYLDSLAANLASNANYLYTAHPFIEVDAQVAKQAALSEGKLFSLEDLQSYLEDNSPSSISSLPANNGPYIGSPVIQHRFVRAQINKLIGRNLIDADALGGIYQNEVNQIDTLLRNAAEFAGANSAATFGIPLTASQANTLSSSGKNIIWPERRRINGRDAIVPVVYLNNTTITNRSVRDHQINFNGTTQFQNVTFDGVTVNLGRDAFMQVAENMTVHNGSVIGTEDANIRVGGKFANLSSIISAPENVSIIAGEIESGTIVHRYDFGAKQGSYYGQLAEINGGEGILLRSSNNILINGSSLTSQSGGITLAADGSIYVGTQPLFESGSFTDRGWNYDYSKISHLLSTFSAQDTIRFIANGEIKIDASTIISDKGSIELLAGLGITVQDVTAADQYHGEIHTRNSDSTVEAYKTFAIRSHLEAGNKVTIHSEAGDITLKAVDISSTNGTSVDAKNGQVNLLATKTTNYYSLTSTYEDLFIVGSYNEGYVEEDIQYNTVVGGFEVSALKGINVEYEGDPNLPLEEQIRKIGTLEGLSWMTTVLDAAKANPDAYQWNAIQAKVDQWKEEHTSLSPAMMAVIAIAVAIAIGPGAGGLISGTGPLAAAASAGISSLASQAVLAIINGSLNGGLDGIGQAMEDLASEDTLKSLAIAMVTAGALSEIDAASMFKDVDPSKVDTGVLSLHDAAGKLSFTGQAVQAVVNSAAQSTISWAIRGGNSEDLQDGFVMNLGQAGINAIGAAMANQIKSYWDFPTADSLDTALKYIAHAGAGCVIGLGQAELSGSSDEKSCTFGGLGAVTGELVGDIHKSATEAGQDADRVEAWLRKNNLQDATELTDEQQKQFLSEVSITTNVQEAMALHRQGVDLARLSGALMAFVSGADAKYVNISAQTAQNAAENNALFLIPIALLLLKAADLASTGMDLWDTYNACGAASATEATCKAFMTEKFGDKIEDVVMEQIFKKIVPGVTTFEKFLEWMAGTGVIGKSDIAYVAKAIADKKLPDKNTYKPSSSGGVAKTKVKDSRTESPIDSKTERNLVTSYQAERQRVLDLKAEADNPNNGLTPEARAELRAEAGRAENRAGRIQEDLAILHAKSLGFTDKGAAKYGGDNGADLVAVRENDQGVQELWVLEVKPFKDGGTQLNATTDSGVQLQKAWLQNVIDRMDVSTEAGLNLQAELRAALRDQKLKTGVMGYDPVKDTMSFVPIDWNKTP